MTPSPEQRRPEGLIFTDADLAEYKERAIKLDRQHTLALLARMEAAEKVCIAADRIALSGLAEYCEAWRKVSGKK